MPRKAASRSVRALDTYRSKRDFTRTSEPAGGREAKDSGFFVVQKHAATRLHFDFRLELDGVLKSWAVTRGPSFDPSVKRLAVRTEDHPIEYGAFEGTIPKGEYGGGTVLLWDRGRWAPRGDPREGLAKGMLKFDLFGERMTGGFALVRMKPKNKETRENWLLVKEKDGAADPDLDPVAEWTTSVSSGRDLDGVASGNSPVWRSSREGKQRHAAAAPKRRDKSKARAIPDFIAPQLATLAPEPPEGKDWLHEIKYDGYRFVAALGGRSRFFTRSGGDWTARFRPIADAVTALRCDSAVLDGEIVAIGDDGRISFSLLQDILKDGGGDFTYFVFDLLRLDGEDLRKKPLVERKGRLAKLLAASPKALRYSDHFLGDSESVLAKACALGLEGIVSKRADKPYASARTSDWVKSKCLGRDEFVIGGYRVSDKKERPFASILVGEYENGELRYRGRVGTGFDDADLESLAAAFEPLKRSSSPFVGLTPDSRRGARWVEPRLVAEVAYSEFTSDGILRHGRFLGLREDKTPEEVDTSLSLSRDAVPSPSRRRRASGSTRGRLGGGESRMSKVDTLRPTKESRNRNMNNRGDSPPPNLPRKGGGTASIKQRAIASSATKVAPKSTSGSVKLTHPDKVLFPEANLTKQALADYFAAVAHVMLPHVKDRPLSLVRCPDGTESGCFFQKHRTQGLPAAMKSIALVENDGDKAEYLMIDNAAGLESAAQIGALEIHLWGSRGRSLEKPDRIVFDLDPGPGVDFAAVRQAARDVHDVLGAAGIESFPLVTGGKGIHVVAPLAKRQGWAEVKAFAKGLATRLASDDPARFVATMAKSKREGRIFIDWLRNERGSTAIAPYSPRAKANASVAAPVSWAELGKVERADAFSMAIMLRRVKPGRRDPWEGYFELRQTIAKAAMKMFAA